MAVSLGFSALYEMLLAETGIFFQFIYLMGVRSLLQVHRMLTFAGAILLVLTFIINYHHQETHSGTGFNYAYLTGVSMLTVFSISLVMFTKNQLKTS